ncbi:MAG: hypothetical protein ABJE66_12505 [Deltaproteobacteria bacterium]
MPARKMFKVLCPMESNNGHKWWMRMGSGFLNKDNSINLYLDAIPWKPGSHLQLRELTEEDMRIANERRASFAPRNANGLATSPMTGGNVGVVGNHVAARHDDVGAGGHADPLPSARELDFPHPADSFTANNAPF